MTLLEFWLILCYQLTLCRASNNVLFNSKLLDESIVQRRQFSPVRSTVFGNRCKCAHDVCNFARLDCIFLLVQSFRFFNRILAVDLRLGIKTVKPIITVPFRPGCMITAFGIVRVFEVYNDKKANSSRKSIVFIVI